MRKKSEPEVYATMGPKDSWHQYGLQALRPDQFVTVVNAIIRGENQLLSSRSTSRHKPKQFAPLFRSEL
jgi:hypothetical protein